MDTTNGRNLGTELMKVFLVTSSVLAIAGYFLSNEMFFIIGSAVCCVLLAGLVIFSLATTPLPVMPVYLIYALVFILLLVIGCLVDRSMGKGLLLGFDFIGVGVVVMVKIVDIVHSAVERDAPEWLGPEYDPDAEEEAGKAMDRLLSLLDGSVPPEDRVMAMSDAFAEMEDIIHNLKECEDRFQRSGRLEDALSRYMDSGLWQKDFEAVEKGKLSPEADEYGVLSEDGLYNLLEEIKEYRDRG